MQVVSRAVVVAIGINALGYREVLGIAVGDSEAEGFWRHFLGSLKERRLTGTRLVISDAHLGLTAAIRRMFQGSSWQRCRVHFLRNLLSHVPKAGQDMVAAAMKAVFVIQAPDQVRSHWQRVTEMLRKQFPTAVPVMDNARDDVLAFLHFPQEHWRKVWSTNPLERLNKEIKRRTNVVGIFPNDAAIVRLVGSQLLEQQEEWQLERRRFFSEATMAKIPEPEEALELTDADPSAQPVHPPERVTGPPELHHSEGRYRAGLGRAGEAMVRLRLTAVQQYFRLIAVQQWGEAPGRSSIGDPTGALGSFCRPFRIVTIAVPLWNLLSFATSEIPSAHCHSLLRRCHGRQRQVGPGQSSHCRPALRPLPAHRSPCGEARGVGGAAAARRAACE
jgi:hypothetical protein